MQIIKRWIAIVVIAFISIMIVISIYVYKNADNQLKIAFFSNRDGNSAIYVMKANGWGLKKLTNTSGYEKSLSWSPDGRKIAFVSGIEKNCEIYTMNADGSDKKRLTKNTAYDLEPSFSPDGKKIAFSSYRDGNSENLYYECRRQRSKKTSG